MRKDLSLAILCAADMEAFVNEKKAGAWGGKAWVFGDGIQLNPPFKFVRVQFALAYICMCRYVIQSLPRSETCVQISDRIYA